MSCRSVRESSRWPRRATANCWPPAPRPARLADLEVDWAAKSISPVAELNVGGPVHAIALSPDGSRLAVAGEFEQGAILLLPPRRQSPSARRKAAWPATPAGVLSLGFSPHGRHAGQHGSRRRGRTCGIWPPASGRQAFLGHSGPVWSAAFSPDGEQVVTAGEDATVRIWRIGENQPRIYRGHDGPVYAVAFAPQGNWIASGGRDRDITCGRPTRI